jgi:hypothetical protein
MSKHPSQLAHSPLSGSQDEAPPALLLAPPPVLLPLVPFPSSVEISDKGLLQATANAIAVNDPYVLNPHMVTSCGSLGLLVRS